MARPTLWGSRADSTSACSNHRGRRPRVGRATAALGRAREPRSYRGSPRFPSARQRATTRGCARDCAPRSPRRSRPARLGADQEDVHTAVEDWLTRRLPGLGERLHTGRSRNDQVACDLRLFLKDRLLALHTAASAGRRARRICAPAPARALAGLHPPAPRDAVVGGSLGRGLRRGSARYDRVAARRCGAGWTARRSAARPDTACRFRSGARSRPGRSASRGLDRNVATVQGGRGKLEAAALFWCTQLGHEVGAPGAGRDPLQRRGVRIPDAAGGAGDRVEHHAAQAESRSLRAHAGPCRRARGRSRRRAADQVASSPAAITATSSCSRSR